MMRRYPAPRLAVEAARSSGVDDPLTAALADGSGLTDDEILMLLRRQRAEGQTDALGGEAGGKWARKMESQVAATAPCIECEDMGWYGVVDPEDPNIVYNIVRTDGEGFDHWVNGQWEPFDQQDVDLLVMDPETAQFAMDALLEGCDGVYLHPGTPMAYVAAAWDESKYKRDASGKFAPKDGGRGIRKPSGDRQMDLANYILKGGKRPSGVISAEERKESKKKGGSGGSGGGSGGGGGGGGSSSKKKSGGSGGSSSSKKKDSGSKSEAKEKAAKKKWDKAKDARARKEAAARLAEATAAIKHEKAEQRIEKKHQDELIALSEEFERLMREGADPLDAEKQLAEKAAEVARKASEREERLEQREKMRKLLYARQMARFRVQRLAHEARKPVTSAAVAEEDWIIYAVVDEIDPNAVMALVRIAPGPELQKWENGDWVEDPGMLAEFRGVNPPPLVELTDEQVESILKQSETTTAAFSPDPNAARLRAYWVSGKGRLKIKWGAPGDFRRCVRQLRKYLGPRVKGYCANLHKLATGMWPGDRRNRGVKGSGASEDVLWDAVLSHGWYSIAAMEGDMLADGIYSETEDSLVQALVAGATFPVEPPDDWFQNPGLSGPTPLTVDDSGHVYGHIATFDVPHIGMPGKVHAPKSRSNYAFFKTGQLVTASGQKINVGQLTLAGGHAPIQADAAKAVKHYDDTASAVADLNVGEDRWGIWAAGALRPEITPDQIRVLRASAPSGDWRPINGNLELVAVCQVNVPGFPVARARVASGAITALVAAGARPLAQQKAALLADSAVQEQINDLRTLVLGDAEMEEPEPVDTEQVVEEPDVPVAEETTTVDRARAYIKEQRMARLRERVSKARTPEPVSAAMGGEWSGKAER